MYYMKWRYLEWCYAYIDVNLCNPAVAVEACERNIRLNGKIALAKVTANHADSRIYMLSHEKEFDVVRIISIPKWSHN